MRTLQFAIVFAVTLSLAFSFSPQAFAGGQCADTYPTAAGPTGTPQPPRFVCNEFLLFTWYLPEQAQFDIPAVNEPDPRIPISHDPDAGPWVKHLEIDQNDIQGQQVIPGYSDTLLEFLVVGPGDPWTDWHEVIMNEPVNEEWHFVLIDISTFPPSNVIIQPTSDKEIWVDFDPPLQPGTFVNIEKELVYDGPDPITPQTLQQFIEVWQYPTIAEERITVAGEILSIDSTALILLGAQSTMAWLIPVAVSAVGIGLVIVRKRI